MSITRVKAKAYKEDVDKVSSKVVEGELPKFFNE